MRCPECNAKVAEDEKECPECGEPLKRKKGKSGKLGKSAAQKLIPTQNLPALIGYYLGVGALIPYIAFLLGPLAIVLGVGGIVYGINNPRAKAIGHCITAIVLPLIGIAGTIVIILLVKNGILQNPIDRLRGK
jgi:hypothetical protein